MFVNQSHPGLRKFRAARAEKQARAIAEKSAPAAPNETVRRNVLRWREKNLKTA